MTIIDIATGNIVPEGTPGGSPVGDSKSGVMDWVKKQWNPGNAADNIDTYLGSSPKTDLPLGAKTLREYGAHHPYSYIPHMPHLLNGHLDNLHGTFGYGGLANYGHKAIDGVQGAFYWLHDASSLYENVELNTKNVEMQMKITQAFYATDDAGKLLPIGERIAKLREIRGIGKLMLENLSNEFKIADDLRYAEMQYNRAKIVNENLDKTLNQRRHSLLSRQGIVNEALNKHTPGTKKHAQALNLKNAISRELSSITNIDKSNIQSIITVTDDEIKSLQTQLKGLEKGSAQYKTISDNLGKAQETLYNLREFDKSIGSLEMKDLERNLSQAKADYKSAVDAELKSQGKGRLARMSHKARHKLNIKSDITVTNDGVKVAKDALKSHVNTLPAGKQIGRSLSKVGRAIARPFSALLSMGPIALAWGHKLGLIPESIASGAARLPLVGDKGVESVIATGNTKDLLVETGRVAATLGGAAALMIPLAPIAAPLGVIGMIGAGIGSYLFSDKVFGGIANWFRSDEQIDAMNAKNKDGKSISAEDRKKQKEFEDALMAINKDHANTVLNSPPPGVPNGSINQAA